MYNTDLHNSYLLINMQNFVHNLNIVNNSLPEVTSLMPVLKCDAYGLGIGQIAKAVQENVISSVESMTGIKTNAVNVKINGVVIEKEPKKKAEAK